MSKNLQLLNLICNTMAEKTAISKNLAEEITTSETNSPTNPHDQEASSLTRLCRISLFLELELGKATQQSVGQIWMELALGLGRAPLQVPPHCRSLNLQLVHVDDFESGSRCWGLALGSWQKYRSSFLHHPALGRQLACWVCTEVCQ